MKPFAILLTIVLFCALLIAILTKSKTKSPKGGFTRFFGDSNPRILNAVDLGKRSFYIAGIDADSLYLGDTAAPLEIWSTSILEQDFFHKRVLFTEPKIKEVTNIQVKGNNISIIGLQSYSLFTGSLTDNKFRELPRAKTFFAEAVPVSGSSFAVRELSNTTKTYVLGKISALPNESKKQEGLLEKQIDGLFCTDGMLSYNGDMNRLIYVYYYRNQFICMDTSLNLLYRNRTIDTISRAQIKVARINSGRTATLASPARIVNGKSFTDADLLFIVSDVVADNESDSERKNKSVIDVYELGDGSYSHSFYVPYFHGHKFKELKVYGNLLIAVSDHFLIIYRISWCGHSF